MDIGLRYYLGYYTFYLENFFYILNLLRRVQKVCTVEVVLNKSDKEIYNNIPKPLRKIVRTKKNIYVYGNLAVTLNKNVVWIITAGDVEGFLEAFLDNPEKMKKDIFNKIRMVKEEGEESVLNRFIASGLIRGEVIRNFKLGEEEIDLVIESEDNTWLIEGKSVFNSTNAKRALGQILFYEEEFYKKAHPVTKNIKKVVVFGKPANRNRRGFKQDIQEIKEMFRKYEIKIYVEGEDF